MVATSIVKKRDECYVEVTINGIEDLKKEMLVRKVVNEFCTANPSWGR